MYAMLRKSELFDLRANPYGDPLTIPRAACLLETSPARIAELVLLGALPGKVENGRPINVDRSAVRQRLDELTRDRGAIR